jgi:hypothetical protein
LEENKDNITESLSTEMMKEITLLVQDLDTEIAVLKEDAQANAQLTPVYGSPY